LRYRPTPFGLFAGIAPARIGPGLAVRWAEEHRPVARADAVWLAELIGRLEACPELLRRLPILADSTCFVRDGRLVVPCQQPAHDSRTAPREVSVRHTRAVQIVIAAAALPVTAGDLASELAARYPGMPAGAIESLLAELVACRVLLTGLRPPMTATDALGHVAAQLSAVGADTIPAVAATVRAVREIQAALARHDGAAHGDREGLRRAAATAMTAQASVTEQPLAVDLRLDCSLTLPYPVIREAEKAADALARLTPSPESSLRAAPRGCGAGGRAARSRRA
jgi:lantibiotic biosynthesis protein